MSRASSASAPDDSGLVYDSDARRLAWLEEAVELWRYRHLVVEIVARDIKVRYKRSVLGVAWTMLSPLLNMLAMTWVFSLVMRMDVRNFPVYFLSGSIFWAFFGGATSHAASLTIDAMEITRRIYIPRSVFVVAAVGVALVNLVLSLVPLFLIILFTGYPVHASWLFVPVSIVIGALFTVGVGLVVFTMASRFVDVKETYLVLVQAWFFVTPIVYTPTLVPERYRFIIRYNPMTYLVEVFRAPLYNGWLPGPKTLAFATLAAISSLVIGWLFYASRIEEYGRGS
jgi:ABC-type polysaccharide/polyol phosphate export permease